MKKIIIKITSLLATAMLLVPAAKAQLPILYGDAVVTHSPTKHPAVGSCTTAGIVVRTIKTANTTTAPWGTQNWNTPLMPFPSPGTKSPNWSAANWTVDKLGTVFGITLDNNSTPNIYVSSTQIYNGANPYSRIVWRLDGISGAHTKVYDFGNAARSLGNVKYYKIGSTENIYVSDWQTGKIQRLTGVSTSSALWTNQPPFTPAFPGASAIPQGYANMPYGLAVRKKGNTYRLYYSRVSTFTNNASGAYGNNEIYSIGLNPANGDFAGTEVKETIPNINSNPTAWGGYPNVTNCPNSAYVQVVLPVISDLAFTDDGTRMLVGQQSWGPGFGQLAPHNSGVFEFWEAVPLSTNWSSTTNSFSLGVCGTLKNAVGGVSYSNNILQKDGQSFACDTTVWFTADCIAYSTNHVVYGIQGMRSGGGSAGNSILIDEDDDISYVDKNDLGDVEIFKKPLQCNPCSCGKWETGPTLNGNLVPGVPIILQTDLSQAKLLPPTGGESTDQISLAKNYPVQFVKGNVSGVINATYLCNGNCGATYTWAITNDATSAIITNGTALPLDLSRYNSLLQCGKYTLVIRAKCGTTDCGSLTIPITIICEPVSCCKSVITTDLGYVRIDAQTNINSPAGYSKGEFDFNFNFSQPVSELRMSVEEFRLKTSSPNCLNCSNRPVTWGNILSAAINGSTGYVTLPLTGASVPSGSAAADYREAVYNTGTPISTGQERASIILSLPTITELSCCEVKAYICIKFTFKDVQCRECVQMICKEVQISPRLGSSLDMKNDAVEIKKYEVRH